MVQSLFWRRSPSPSQSACPAAWAEALCSIIRAGRLFWLDARWTKELKSRGMTRKGSCEKSGEAPQPPQPGDYFLPLVRALKFAKLPLPPSVGALGYVLERPLDRRPWRFPRNSSETVPRSAV